MNDRDRAQGLRTGARALSVALFGATGAQGVWRQDRACRDTDPRVFDAETARSRDQARRICSACPVQRQCATEQIEWEAGYPAATRYLHGVVGGLTPADRRLIHHPTTRDHHPVAVSNLDGKAA
ncbi:WhiB family transcriptional regulator [Kutzneria kofuensis]|uniref:4Fe-4S Wbl-type domain-containing protein n=1 Tax=Kutzneria kofuensis TaxID=103725 RepID=A0A7W9KEE4_9PSEU|nr:WhiB family transcriptional regulator [Kutzneria kofuensis]MBB5891011.1 hypothetical protein [Kutzneria kofuensis]